VPRPNSPTLLALPSRATRRFRAGRNAAAMTAALVAASLRQLVPGHGDPDGVQPAWRRCSAQVIGAHVRDRRGGTHADRSVDLLGGADGLSPKAAMGTHVPCSSNQDFGGRGSEQINIDASTVRRPAFFRPAP
jgi:hypothetical protein